MILAGSYSHLLILQSPLCKSLYSRQLPPMVWSGLLSLWALLVPQCGGQLIQTNRALSAQRGLTLMTPSDPDYLSKAPALNSTIHWELKLQYVNLRRYNSIHSNNIFIKVWTCTHTFNSFTI